MLRQNQEMKQEEIHQVRGSFHGIRDRSRGFRRHRHLPTAFCAMICLLARAPVDSGCVEKGSRQEVVGRGGCLQR